jgi:hypothetical protein
MSTDRPKFTSFTKSSIDSVRLNDSQNAGDDINARRCGFVNTPFTIVQVVRSPASITFPPYQIPCLTPSGLRLILASGASPRSPLRLSRREHPQHEFVVRLRLLQNRHPESCRRPKNRVPGFPNPLRDLVSPRNNVGVVSHRDRFSGFFLVHLRFQPSFRCCPPPSQTFSHFFLDTIYSMMQVFRHSIKPKRYATYPAT